MNFSKYLGGLLRVTENFWGTCPNVFMGDIYKQVDYVITFPPFLSIYIYVIA